MTDQRIIFELGPETQSLLTDLIAAVGGRKTGSQKPVKSAATTVYEQDVWDAIVETANETGTKTKSGRNRGEFSVNRASKTLAKAKRISDSKARQRMDDVLDWFVTGSKDFKPCVKFSRELVHPTNKNSYPLYKIIRTPDNLDVDQNNLLD